MARSASKAELETCLGRLDPDYSQFAPTLWQNGVRTACQLANATKPLLLSWALPELCIDDIKATAGRTGVAASSDVLEPLKKFAETAAENVYKRLKYTQTPLHTACQAGKALLESAQLCGAELVHALPWVTCLTHRHWKQQLSH